MQFHLFFASAITMLVMIINLIDARLIVVRPTDASFIQDAQEFNSAPSLMTQSHQKGILSSLLHSTTNTSSSSSSSLLPNEKQHPPQSLAATIYFCHSESEIEEALNLILSSSSSSLPQIQVRSGRHSYTALASTTTNAAVIDIANMTISDNNFNNKHHDYEQDPKMTNMTMPPQPYESVCGTNKEPCTLIKLPGGLRLFQMYAYLSTLNLYTPGGSCPSVGVSGFVLGGGIGLYSRQRGLGVQNLFGARVAQVNKNRQVIWKNVSETENADLLWALRGGANNNFGVVSELTLRVYPAPSSVSSIRVSTTSCVQMTDIYQQFLEESDSNGDAGDSALCNITATLYYYHDHCGVVVLATSGISYDELYENYVSKYFVKKLPSATTTISTEVKDETVWLKGLASISGCSSVENCFERTGRVPNLNGLSYWTAFSVFTNRSLSVANGEVQKIIQAIQAPLPSSSSSSVTTNCTFFPVLIADGLRCQVKKLSQTVNTSFPWASDALYHTQILAYNTANGGHPNITNNEIAQCQKSVQQYVKNIFNQYDSALVDYKASYRNYPNEELPNALSRYYSEENLKKLQTMASEADPLRVFTKYSQGLL